MSEKQRETASKEFPQWKEWFIGTGTLGFTMCNSVMNTFYFFFLTNVVQMSPAFMAIVTTVSRFAGVFYAPIKGVIMDKAEWKSGKYSVYMKWFEPIGRILMCLCFVNVQASQTVQFIYYVGIFVVAGFFLTFPDTAALGAIRLVAKTPDAAVRMSSKKSVVATAGQVLYSLVTVSLVALLGKGDQGKGYLWVYILYSAIAIIGYQLTAAIVTKDYDLYKVDNAKKEEKAVEEKVKIPFSTYIKSYTHSFAPISLLIGDACKASASLLYAGAITYYLTYYVQQPEKLTPFLMTANISMLVGSYCCPFVAKLVGKKWTNVISYGGFGLFLILGYFVGVGTALGITACVGAGRFCSGLNASIIGAYYIDMAEDYENKCGVNMTSFYMSVGGLSWTLASVFCGTIVGTTLAKVGFSATAPVTQPMLDAMLRLNTLIPGIPLAIGTVIFALGYNLTDKHMEKVHAELQAKKAAAAEKAE